jgi:hypothetical protein
VICSGHVDCYDELDMWLGLRKGINERKTLAGKRLGRQPSERPTRRWEYNFKTDRRDISSEDSNLIELAQDFAQWLLSQQH